MRLSIRNLDYLRQKDHLLYQAVMDLKSGIDNMASQLVANPNGETSAPPQISSLTVTASNGVFTATIFDNNPVLRGIEYFLEFGTVANFGQPTVVSLGPSRQWVGFLGSQTFYFRAYSQYPTSPPSAPVYFGNSSSPTGVAGGGTVSGGLTGTGTGSGTGSSIGTNGGEGYGRLRSRGTVRFE